MHRETEMLLHHLDRALSRPGRSKAASVSEGRHVLMRVFSEIIHGPFPMREMGMEMHETMQMLRHRIDRAHSVDEIRDIARDIRQLVVLSSTTRRARDMEGRIRDLEGQLKSMTEETPLLPADPDEKVVTIEKLKGKRVLFALMPFHEDFHDVWIGGIQRAATGTGLYPIRIDMITQSSAVTDDIVAAIELAEVIVVDVSRNNPNVMFEFGFALAKNKPHIVISQSTEFLTFDIEDVRTVMYRNCWKGIEDLHKELQRFIKGTIGEKGRKK